VYSRLCKIQIELEVPAAGIRFIQAESYRIDRNVKLFSQSRGECRAADIEECSVRACAKLSEQPDQESVSGSVVIIVSGIH